MQLIQMRIFFGWLPTGTGSGVTGTGWSSVVSVMDAHLVTTVREHLLSGANALGYKLFEHFSTTGIRIDAGDLPR